MLIKDDVINDRYVLKEFIGQGGMGDVWKALDKHLNRYVALKFALPQFIKSEPKSLKILTDEAQTGAKLIGHPNIVNIIDFSSFNKNGQVHYFIVMELVAGIDVSVWINEYMKKLAPTVYYKISLFIALQLCKAISYSHQREIFHRDIKPHNIFLSQFGITKVGDFGLSRFIEIATRTHTMKGAMTYGYAAPEQWLEDKHTEAIDVYQVGCTIYHLLTGVLPFEKNSLPALMNAHLNELPLTPMAHSKEISGPLADVILKALHKDPEERAEIWELHDELVKELLIPCTLEMHVYNDSEEIIELVAKITEFTVNDLRDGDHSRFTIPDYTELLSECIQLILNGVYKFKFITSGEKAV